MNRLVILGAVFLSLNLSTYGQTKDWNTIKKDAYSIDYPKDWELDESGQMGTSVIIISPLSSQKDQFRENVTVIAQDLTGYNVDLNEYVSISESQIKAMITNAKIIESKRVKIQDLSYHKIVYTGKQGVYSLKFAQYYYVVGDKAYVLTLTCENTQFDDYQLIGEKILNSFKLNN